MIIDILSKSYPLSGGPYSKPYTYHFQAHLYYFKPPKKQSHIILKALGFHPQALACNDITEGRNSEGWGGLWFSNILM